MPRAVVLVPGVSTSRAEAEMWALRLGEQIRRACPDVLGAHLYWHGWIFPPAIRFRPFRAHAVARYQAFVEGLARRYGPGIDLDVCGYSWGTFLVGHSMTEDGGAKADYGRVVLMGSILSSRDTWRDKLGHYARALNLWSREDEVVRFSTLGQSGWKGFLDAPEAVRNVEVTPMEHEDYQRPGPAWDDAAAFLSMA